MMSSSNVLKSTVFCVLAVASLSQLTSSSTSTEADTSSEHVIVFQASGRASTDSLLEFRKEIPQMTAITLCAWLRFRHFMPVVDKIVSYFTVGDEDIKIYYDFINKEFVIWTPGYRLTISIVIPLYTWTHIFMTFDLITTENYVLVNNEEVKGEVSLNNEEKVGSSLAAGGLLVLGQDQDSLGGGYAITQAFSGDMAQLLMYSKFFSRKDRRTFNCFENRLGLETPILSTSVLEDWEFVGDVETQQIPRHLISPSQKVNFFVLPENEYFSDAAKLCRVLGLPLALPKSEEQNEELFKMAVGVESICITAYSTNVWLGVRANFTTMSWENANNNGRLGYENFDPLYSTLSETDRCVSLGSSHYPRVWHKTSCQKYKPCPACENAPVNSIQVRGLCLQSNFDRRLHIHGTKNLKPMFHGTFYTQLWWDNSTWIMASRLLPRLEARMVIDHTEAYPIGLHRWHVSGDECPAEQLDLLLTVCGEDSFPCSDGTCVLMSQRCDLRAHCDDGSDETECDIVYLQANYERTLPPPPPEKENVLNVTLSIVITAVRTLNLLDQTVTLDVRLTSEWQDSRLKYNDLHSEQFRNQLQDHERLWLPRLITTDDTGSRVDVVTRGESLVVLRGSEPLPADDTRVKKAIVYPGSGNPLLLRQELSISFQCQFDLRWFPFDNQRCSLNLKLNEVESKLVNTIASDPQYLGPEKLPEYEVRAVTMQSRTAGDSGQQLTVRFTNLYRYYLANSYLPSFLLVVISYSTFYFRLEDFNERIMVSITAMLVLVALFSQTSSTILKTTYLKLIDIWYMVCIVVDFVMVMMLALIDFVLHNHSSNRIMVMPSSKNSRSRYFPSNAEKLNKIGRVALPLLFLAFLLVYAIIACVKYVMG